MAGHVAAFLAPLVALGVLTSLSSCTTLEQMEEQVNNLEKTVEQLTRQLMLQQLYVDEQTRSSGGSGLKQTRQVTQGTLPFHATTATVDRIAAIHEHANNDRIVGLGEVIAVLNGHEFRTRHNDFKLVQPKMTDPGKTKNDYDAVTDIPFPEVPQAVTDKETLQEQIEEMRLWFKAWKDQNYSVRDYRPYFKALLCYLEGAWTVSENDALDESFESDRHFLDASSWLDLQDKIRYTSYGGRKDSEENYAYLPTTIMSTRNGSMSLAQWNYRILCHPLKRDLSPNRLKLIDDVTSRMAFGRTMETHGQSRAARYRVAPHDRNGFPEKFMKFDLLDELMGEIPGKDGYGNELEDNGLDDKPAMNLKTSGNLPAGYYHRWFKTAKDAMGSGTQHRAFSDENLFMAKTTQEKVASITIKRCTGRGRNEKCSDYSQRWSYAIPMEIIYLTPLQRWNPHDIEYKGLFKSKEAESVTAGGKNGTTKELALNGIHNKVYYLTPVEFFAELKEGSDKADTAAKSLWVLNKDNEAKQVVAAGARIHLPEIEGSGILRTRYPIMPLHDEGSATWKELTALKHTMLESNKYRNMFYNGEGIGEPEPGTITLLMQTALDAEPHEHYVYVDRQDLMDLYMNKTQLLEGEVTEQSLGHTHTINVGLNWKGELKYKRCDNKRTCWDNHPTPLEIVDD